MGTSTDFIGLVSSEDPTYIKQKKVLLACLEAGVELLPVETAKYFGSPYPKESLLEKKVNVRNTIRGMERR